MKFNPILAAAVLVLLGCDRSNSDSITKIDSSETMVVEPLKQIQNITKLSELVSEVIYIPLEETDESLIGEIQNVTFVHDRIYVIDNIASIILAFQTDGKFLFSIGRKGEGPGEYEELNQMTYDFEKDQIILTSNKKIIWLDSEGGFLREMISPLAGAKGLHCLKDSRLAFYMRYSNLDRFTPPHNICITDSLGNVVQRALPVPRGFNFRNSTGLYNYFQNSTPTGLLTQPYSLNIISLGSTGFKAKYRLSFGVNDLPEDYDASVLTDQGYSRADIERLELNEHYARPFGIAALDTKDYLHFTFRLDQRVNYVFHNKNSKRNYEYTFNVENDIGGLEHLYSFTTHGNYFVSRTYTSELKESLNQGLVNDPQLVQAIDKLPATENPVLRLVKIK